MEKILLSGQTSSLRDTCIKVNKVHKFHRLESSKTRNGCKPTGGGRQWWVSRVRLVTSGKHVSVSYTAHKMTQDHKETQNLQVSEEGKALVLPFLSYDGLLSLLSLMSNLKYQQVPDNQLCRQLNIWPCIAQRQWF